VLACQSSKSPSKSGPNGRIARSADSSASSLQQKYRSMMKKPRKNIERGMYLIMDGNCSGLAVLDRPKLQEAVKELVDEIGKEHLASLGITVPRSPKGIDPEDAKYEYGVSVCAIGRSIHATIHTWPKRRAFKLDIYNFEVFDPEVVIRWAVEKLNTTAINDLHHWRR